MCESLANPTPREQALAHLREAKSALENVPAVALDDEKHDRLCSADDDVEALERALAHEVEQQREAE